MSQGFISGGYAYRKEGEYLVASALPEASVRSAAKTQVEAAKCYHGGRGCGCDCHRRPHGGIGCLFRSGQCCEDPLCSDDLLGLGIDTATALAIGAGLALFLSPFTNCYFNTNNTAVPQSGISSSVQCDLAVNPTLTALSSGEACTGTEKGLDGLLGTWYQVAATRLSVYTQQAGGYNVTSTFTKVGATSGGEVKIKIRNKSSIGGLDFASGTLNATGSDVEGNRGNFNIRFGGIFGLFGGCSFPASAPTSNATAELTVLEVGDNVGAINYPSDATNTQYGYALIGGNRTDAIASILVREEFFTGIVGATAQKAAVEALKLKLEARGYGKCLNRLNSTTLLSCSAAGLTRSSCDCCGAFGRCGLSFGVLNGDFISEIIYTYQCKAAYDCGLLPPLLLAGGAGALACASGLIDCDCLLEDVFGGGGGNCCGCNNNNNNCCGRRGHRRCHRGCNRGCGHYGGGGGCGCGCYGGGCGYC